MSCKKACVELALLQMAAIWSCQGKLWVIVTPKYLADYTASSAYEPYPQWRQKNKMDVIVGGLALNLYG